MKKILLATLCITALGLSACDKTSKDNSTTSTAATAKQSTNTPADIKADLAKIETLSLTKSPEALGFQTKVSEALRSNDKAALGQLFKDMKAFVKDFNQALDALNIKSTEVESMRNLMKEANLLGIELAEEEMSSKPNVEKINELTQKATEAQKEFMSQMMTLKQIEIETK